jgi:hypothetical protein
VELHNTAQYTMNHDSCHAVERDRQVSVLAWFRRLVSVQCMVCLVVHSVCMQLGAWLCSSLESEELLACLVCVHCMMLMCR